VHRLETRSANRTDSLEGFAFKTPGETVCLWVNPGASAATAIVCGLSGEVTTSTFAPASTGPARASLPGAKHHAVTIPARGVTILVATSDRSQPTITNH
jgi:hypothetical protein